MSIHVMYNCYYCSTHAYHVVLQNNLNIKYLFAIVAIVDCTHVESVTVSFVDLITLYREYYLSEIFTAHMELFWS